MARRRTATHLGLPGLAIGCLAACANVAQDSPDACKFEKLGDVPLTGSVLQPIVKIEIDGKPLNMLLDTGHGAMLVFQGSFDRLGFEQDRSVVAIGGGIGGVNGLYSPVIMRSHSVRIAGQEAHYPQLHVWVGPFSIPSASSIPIDGLLGQDILGRYDLDLDFPHHLLTLYRPRSCPSGTPPWFTPHVLVPRPKAAPADARVLAGVDDGAFVSGNLHLYMTVALDGQPITAVIDTGATGLYLDRAAAARIGVTAEQLAHDATILSQGASAYVSVSAIHHFATLDFLDQKIAAPTVSVGEIGSNIEMLIGMGVLQSYRMWIPVQGGKIYFGPATRPDPV